MKRRNGKCSNLETTNQEDNAGQDQELAACSTGSKLKEELSKKHACYVLITCDTPSCDGKMQVEMSYEGDATLAAYILHGAQLHIDEQDIDASVPSDKLNKIHYLES